MWDDKVTKISFAVLSLLILIVVLVNLLCSPEIQNIVQGLILVGVVGLTIVTVVREWLT